MSFALCLVTPANDALTFVNHTLFGRRLRKTELSAPPIFIIGHWRSGTTLLHELLMLDPRLACPNTYQCFAPNHFLITEWFFRSFGNWLLPNKRPMDNVAAGWDRPQEDEFALMNLGLPSPYRRIAFPRNPAPHLEYLDFEKVSPAHVEIWLRGLESFLIAVTAKQGGRVVLKSPTHTGRVGPLAKHFPGAKFVHITRDPQALLPSTVRMWRSLDETQGLQKPTEHSDKQYVHTCMRRMYDAFHRDRHQIPSSDLIDIRYEDLVTSPQQTLEQVYSQLELGDFEPLRTPLNQWINQHHRGYQTNKHRLSHEDANSLRQHWSEYAERYGYELADATAGEVNESP